MTSDGHTYPVSAMPSPARLMPLSWLPVPGIGVPIAAWVFAAPGANWSESGITWANVYAQNINQTDYGYIFGGKPTEPQNVDLLSIQVLDSAGPGQLNTFVEQTDRVLAPAVDEHQ